MFAFGLAFAAPSYATDVPQSPGITINGNSGFSTCGCATGAGTASNPYVVGPFAITSENSSGSAVTVENVTADFRLTGISANYTDSNPSNAVIEFSNVHPTDSATLTGATANSDGIGAELDNSSNILLASNSFNKMFGAGVKLNGSSYITLVNGKYKATSDEVPFHDADGLYALNSSHIQIGGVPGCANGVCNTFDYDSGWGVYLQNTSNVTIDHASANADDTGSYILDGASNVTLENSTAEAGGPICISLNGAKEPSGYYNTGLVGGLFLINGASNNTIENDNITGISQTSGYDIAGAPNPFYFNVCTGANSSTFVPSGTAMGSGNTFSNLCYQTSNDVADLPPSNCKS